MDGNGKKAARPAPATDSTQQQPAAALCDDNAATAQQVDVAASVDESHGTAAVGGGGGNQEKDDHDDDDDDDEQVERFYALLANIRAMRGLSSSSPHNMAMSMASSSACGGGSSGDTDTDSAGDCTTRKKRLRRSAEPPWRPAFRMEDFEEPPQTPTSTSCKLRKLTSGGAGHDDHCGHGESSGGSARPPVAVADVDAARGGTVPTV